MTIDMLYISRFKRKDFSLRFWLCHLHCTISILLIFCLLVSSAIRNTELNLSYMFEIYLYVDVLKDIKMYVHISDMLRLADLPCH